jgi:hypothetical protein
MRIRPNRSTLEGEVIAIRRSADGVGAEVDMRVTANRSRGAAADFTAAVAGQAMTLFAAVPEALEPGGRYRFEVCVLGGPQGERIVVETAKPLPR